MSIIYVQKNENSVQTKHERTVSVPDSSSQSESLQRKADIANNAAQREETPRPNNTGMPDNLKSGIEILSGFSMDDVRVHYNSSKPATVQALAYTQGTDIHVAPGQEKHLPHEAWHVAQQMAGRVSPTTNINGTPVNDNAGLEHEADVMGGKAEQCKKKTNITHVNMNVSVNTSQNTVQRKFWEKIGEKYIFHDENPTEFYVLLKKPWWYRYPVYARLFDTRKLPQKDDTVDKIKTESTNLNVIFLLLDKKNKKDFNDYVDTLIKLCNNDGIISVIEGALKNTHLGSIIHLDASEEIKKRQIELFINRLRLMTEYIEKVGNQLYADKTIKDFFWIKSTGSDPHKAGEHALFLYPKPGCTQKKRVYKPHSLEFEAAFMGKENSFFTILNKILPPEHQLATMDIDDRSHTEEHIEKVQDLKNEDTFHTYMYQLGMLEIASKVFGITDLHCENILFGEKGPFAIDAECGGAFGKATNIENGFYPPVVTEETTMINPSALYVRKVPYSNRDDGNWYTKGKTDMSLCIKTNEHYITNALKNIFETKNNIEFRILPFSTDLLSTFINGYSQIGDSYFTTIMKTLWDDFTKYLRENRLMQDTSMCKSYKHSFEDNFKKAIGNGTIPVFKCMILPMEMANNDLVSVFLDGTLVYYCKTKSKNVYLKKIQDEISNL